jgi:tRNA1Val (adenine37-N6)-methyltransferase
MHDDFFKGWAKPGLRRNSSSCDVGLGETKDTLCGHFEVFQLKNGYRYSSDDMLAAWYGTSWCPSASRVLELGSGIGTVSMVAAWRLPGATFVCVEAQEVSHRLAAKSAAHNGLTQRLDLRLGDFRDPGVLRDDERFDLVLANPPYFAEEAGVESQVGQKRACRFELRGDIADYCKVPCARRRSLPPDHASHAQGCA